MAATPKRNTPTKRRSSTTPTSRKRKTPSSTATANHRKNHFITTLSPPSTPPSPLLAASSSPTTPTSSLHFSSSSISLSSSSISLSKLQSLIPPPPQPQQQLYLSIVTPPLSSTWCWFEQFLLSSITDEDPRWVQIFRMSKPTFSLLSSAVSQYLSDELPPSIPLKFALGCGLYKLAHDGSFSFVGRRFGFSSGVACRVFYTVCKVICEVLGDYVGKFWGRMGGGISMGFDRFSMKNCCGVLGFEKFGLEGGEILGKVGFLIVQALVDCNGRFMDVSVGWPSTFLPVSILRQTRLFVGVEESKELLNGPKIELFDGNLVNQYVLGDRWYPCLPWLITPFVRKGEGLSSSEIEFNEVHKREMGFVKMAFGRVRANWKVLDRRWKEEFVEFLPFVITTACVLNNFLMKHGETLPDGDVVGSGEEVEEMSGYDGEVCESGAKVRDLLALHLSRVSQAPDN